MRQHREHRDARLRRRATPPRKVVVIYRPEDAGFGGRLRGDLIGRLGADRIAGDGDGDGAAQLVLVIGPGWLDSRDGAGRQRLADPSDPLRSSVEQALGDGRTVIPLIPDGGSLPSASELPPSLAPLAKLEPVRASDDYWDAALDRLIGRLGAREPATESRLRRLARRYLKLATITAVIGAAAAIVAILKTFGVFDNPEHERGALTVDPTPASGITVGRFMADFARRGQPRPDDGGDLDAQGYVYDVQVDLARPQAKRYTIRWTIREQATNAVVHGLRDRVGDRFPARLAPGTHEVWVPCPPNLDDVPYVVRFTLVNEAHPDAPPLDSKPSGLGDCRMTES
jgi:hypothetical protein